MYSVQDNVAVISNEGRRGQKVRYMPEEGYIIEQRSCRKYLMLFLMWLCDKPHATLMADNVV
jgi:hypothetical protein